MKENEKKILKEEQPEQSAKQVSDEDMAGVTGGKGSDACEDKVWQVERLQAEHWKDLPDS